MTLEVDFLTTAADTLAQNLARIETRLAELPPRSLRARDSENENGVGNLLLHLEGNVRQWIISSVGAGRDQLLRQNGQERRREGDEEPFRERVDPAGRPVSIPGGPLRDRTGTPPHRRERARNTPLRDLLAADSRRNVYAGKLEVRPAGAPIAQNVSADLRKMQSWRRDARFGGVSRDLEPALRGVRGLAHGLEHVSSAFESEQHLSHRDERRRLDHTDEEPTS